MNIFHFSRGALSKYPLLLLILLCFSREIEATYTPEELCDDILYGNVQKAIAGLNSIDIQFPKTEGNILQALEDFMRPIPNIMAQKGFPTIGPKLAKTVAVHGAPLIFQTYGHQPPRIIDFLADYSGHMDEATKTLSDPEKDYLDALIVTYLDFDRWEYMGLLGYLNSFALIPVISLHADERSVFRLKDKKAPAYIRAEALLATFSQGRLSTTSEDIERLKRISSARRLSSSLGPSASCSHHTPHEEPHSPPLAVGSSSDTEERDFSTHPIVRDAEFLTAIYRLAHNARKGAESQPKYPPLAFILFGLVGGKTLEEISPDFRNSGFGRPLIQRKTSLLGRIGHKINGSPEHSIPEDRLPLIMDTVEIIADQIAAFGPLDKWSPEMQDYRAQSLFRMACYSANGVGRLRNIPLAENLYEEYAELCSTHTFEKRKKKW